MEKEVTVQKQLQNQLPVERLWRRQRDRGGGFNQRRRRILRFDIISVSGWKSGGVIVFGV